MVSSVSEKPGARSKLSVLGIGKLLLLRAIAACAMVLNLKKQKSKVRMINKVRFLMLLYLIIASYVETCGAHLKIQEVSGE